MKRYALKWIQGLWIFLFVCSNTFLHAYPIYAQEEPSWVIGQENEQAIPIQLINQTEQDIVSIQIIENQQKSENLIPDLNVFLPGETKDFYYKTETPVDMMITLDGLGQYTISDISLEDIQEKAELFYEEDKVYLEYVSKESQEKISTKETSVKEEGIGQAEMDKQSTEQTIENSEEQKPEGIEEKQEEQKEETKEESEKNKDEEIQEEYPVIEVQNVTDPVMASSLSQTQAQAPFFEVDPSTGQTSVQSSISDLAGMDESYQEIVSSSQYNGSTSEKVESALEESGMYDVQPTENGVLETTSIYAYKRLLVFGQYQSSIQAYGAQSAIYYKSYFVLTYDSEEKTRDAYEKLMKDFGESNVVVDVPIQVQETQSVKGWGYETMNFSSEVQRASQSNNTIIVAVLDSGVVTEHPIFVDENLLPGININDKTKPPIDVKSHGTATTGIIAESTPNNIQILPIRVTDDNGAAAPLHVLLGLDYAKEQGASIANISVGGPLAGSVLESQYESLIEQMNGYDFPIVVASGNDGKIAENIKYFPSTASDVISVGSITKSKKKSSFSNIGVNVDFCAPGSSVSVAVVSGLGYATKNGTSFAAPYITAAASLFLVQNPSMTKEELYQKLVSLCEDLGTAGKDTSYGHGLPVLEGAKNGFFTQNGKTIYYDNNVLAKGKKEIDGFWYMFDEDYSMVTGWYDTTDKDGTHRFYFDQEGHMLFGWQTIDGKRYYFDSAGALQKGFLQLKDNYYWLDSSNGALSYTGVVKNPKDNKWYFVRNGVGESFTGWSKSILNGKWYFTRSGVLDWSFTGVAKSVQNGSWYHGKNGELDWNFTGLSKSVANNKWYFSRKGKLDWNFTGVAKSIQNGKWYFARKGELDWNYNGGALSVANGKWYAVEKGALNWNYNGKLSCTDGKSRTFKKGEAI